MFDLSFSEPADQAVSPPDVPAPAPTPFAHAAATSPTQKGAEGIVFDFNLGCRVLLPVREDGRTWHIRLSDLDTGNILFERRGMESGLVRSSKRWYVRFEIEVWVEEPAGGDETPVLRHAMDLRDRTVLIQFSVGTLGDTLAWMPYAARFAERHGARVICALSDLIRPLFETAYPHILFVTPEELGPREIMQSAYATYYLGLFFDDAARDWHPIDFRHVGLHKTAAYILGVSPEEEPARIAFADPGRPLAEPYVCIAVQASSQCKYWNNPFGWAEVIAWLKERGYRVVCIDRKPVHGTGLVWNHIPFGVEDQTGDRPLTERAWWLKHAALFIGGSSGLAWLAWSAGCTVTMISGFTHPDNEFATPGRIINWHTCNACWNDPRERFDHQDFLWCPRHRGTDRQFECTRLIPSAYVIRVIERLLSPGPRKPTE
ncbi:MAG: autotransporter strand-loop-strand O-heptosyltransferase [Gluconacetobacter liquefaciens]